MLPRQERHYSLSEGGEPIILTNSTRYRVGARDKVYTYAGLSFVWWAPLDEVNIVADVAIMTRGSQRVCTLYSLYIYSDSHPDTLWVCSAYLRPHINPIEIMSIDDRHCSWTCNWKGCVTISIYTCHRVHMRFWPLSIQKYDVLWSCAYFVCTQSDTVRTWIISHKIRSEVYAFAWLLAGSLYRNVIRTNSQTPFMRLVVD